MLRTTMRYAPVMLLVSACSADISTDDKTAEIQSELTKTQFYVPPPDSGAVTQLASRLWLHNHRQSGLPAERRATSKLQYTRP